MTFNFILFIIVIVIIVNHLNCKSNIETFYSASPKCKREENKDNICGIDPRCIEAGNDFRSKEEIEQCIKDDIDLIKDKRKESFKLMHTMQIEVIQQQF